MGCRSGCPLTAGLRYCNPSLPPILRRTPSSHPRSCSSGRPPHADTPGNRKSAPAPGRRWHRHRRLPANGAQRYSLVPHAGSTLVLELACESGTAVPTSETLADGDSGNPLGSRRTANSRWRVTSDESSRARSVRGVHARSGLAVSVRDPAVRSQAARSAEQGPERRSAVPALGRPRHASRR